MMRLKKQMSEDRRKYSHVVASVPESKRATTTGSGMSTRTANDISYGLKNKGLGSVMIQNFPPVERVFS